MKFVPCNSQNHGTVILDTFNEVIATSTALYEYVPRTPEFMASWFADKAAGNYPIIGALDDSGALLGFGTYGVFRSKPAYKYSVEHSLYVHKNHRGKGVGAALLERTIEAAKAQGYHVMVGGIDADNAASIELHKKFGFVHSGTVTQSGFKFGRWLDVAFYQLTLPTPVNPIDG